MNEYLLLFRRDYKTKELHPTPYRFQKNLKQWSGWFGKLKAEDRIVIIPSRFDGAGKILNSNKTVADGPYPGPKKNLLGALLLSKLVHTNRPQIPRSTALYYN
jgi:hypothetical protein